MLRPLGVLTMNATTVTTPPALGPPTPHPDLAAVERVVMGGDLAPLTIDERLLFIRQMCDSLGLNPSTQPLIYLKDKRGKLGVYCTKDGCAQLRRNHNVSLEIRDQQIVNDTLIVRVRAS